MTRCKGCGLTIDSPDAARILLQHYAEEHPDATLPKVTDQQLTGEVRTPEPVPETVVSGTQPE